MGKQKYILLNIIDDVYVTDKLGNTHMTMIKIYYRILTNKT